MWYDLVILAVLALATIRGAFKGFVWQVAAIAAIVLCFAFSETVSLAVAPLIGVEPPLNRWISMFVLYVVCSFVAFAAARQLRGWIEKVRFVEYDRHLGAVFGFLKGALFCVVLTFFVVTLSEDAKTHVLNSHSGHASAIIMDRLHPVMPAELHDVLEPYIHQLDRPGLDLRHSHGFRDPADGGPDLDGGHVHDDHGHATGDPPNHDHAAGDTHPPAPFPSGEHAATTPAGGEQGGGTPDPAMDRRRTELLEEIATLFSDFPAAQAAIIEEIDLALAGLPDRVCLAVLEDWYADLMAIDFDPDPQTGLTTPLDVRIVRQLSAANIPLTTLSSGLQTRLRESSPR